MISEVFIGDPIKLRKDIYELWLQGTPVAEAVKIIKEQNKSKPIVNMNIDTLIYEDVLDSVNNIHSNIIV